MERTLAHDAAEQAPNASPASRIPEPAGGSSAVLALQRAAGNRAVAAMLAPRDTRALGRTAAGHAPAPGALRRAAAGRRMLQRDVTPVPPFDSKPSWSSAGPNNPKPTCTPYDGIGNLSFEGAVTWRTLFSVIDVPKVLGDRCNCSLVRDAYSLFFRAQVPKARRAFDLSDNGNCISEQLAKSAAHNALENRLQAKWKAIERAKAPLILAGGVRDAEIDLIEATEAGNIVPVDSVRPLKDKIVDTDIEYGENNLAGGLLFGGGSATGRKTDDSEFGPDTRDLTGTIKLRRFDTGGSTTRMSVEATFTFKYKIHDALDFCPGNTLQKDDFTVDRLQYNEIITDLSRLEASGMARDVGFDVRYHRTATTSSDIPIPVPVPTPKKIVTVPAEALFDFDKDHLRPEAEATLLAFLGDQPKRQDASKRVQVRGHTDGKGSAAYNQGLSERRAEAIRELLERTYPNLVGQVDAIGFGETQPVALNTNPDGSDNPAGRAANRRVDIEFDIDVP